MAIQIAANYINLTPGWGHLQIVRVDGTSKLEIEAQAPDLVLLGDFDFPPIRDHTTNTPNYSDTNTNYYAAEAVTLPDGMSEDAVWSILAQVHNQFLTGGFEIDYNFNQNSNAYVTTLLSIVGIDMATYLQGVTAPDIDSFPSVERNILTDRVGGGNLISLNITGSNGNDTIRLGIGNDTLIGNGGKDTLHGGGGIDTLYGDAQGGEAESDGDDVLRGEGGDDILIGNGGDDKLYGGANNDTLSGGSGWDVLRGGGGNDHLHGGSGVDRLYGGNGNDQLIGGTGPDGPGSFDALYGGLGNDIIVTGELAGVDPLTFDLSEAEPEAILASLQDGTSAGAPLGYEPDNAFGGDGDDDFYSGGWGDFLVGGAGDDDFYFQNQIGFGASYVIGGSGADNYYFQSETFDPGEGGGSSFTDIIGIFDIAGLTDWAADFIDIGLLRDAVSLAVFETGLDTTLDYALFNIGGDSLYLDGSQQPFFGNQFVPVIDFTNPVYNIQINIDDIADAPEEPLPPPPVEETGGEGDDDIRGDGGDDLLNGGAGNDTLRGRAGNDALDGGMGNDRLNGGAGGDVLNGGEGNGDTAAYGNSNAGVAVSLAGETASGGDAEGDTLTGIENLAGSSYEDFLEGDAADNRLAGRDGDDQLIGGAGDDRLIGGAGADGLNGGSGVDTAVYLASEAGISVFLADGMGSGGDAEGDSLEEIENLVGSRLDDVLSGDAGDNRLAGREGDDVILGGEGNDRLLGELGDDILTGGAGRDVFIFNESFGSDTITDFEAGTGPGDKIRLNGDHGVTDFADLLSASADQFDDEGELVGTLVSLGTGSIFLEGIEQSALHESDFVI